MSKVTMKYRGVKQMNEGTIDHQERTVEINKKRYGFDELSFDSPVSRTIYGTLLNYKGAYEALEASMQEEPYNAPPNAPILYIKPENTFAGFGSPIPLPTDVTELEIGAALGVVIGKTATQVKETEALEYVKGYTIVNDVSIPHESVHRPAVKQKARDGFCPIGPWITDCSAIENPNKLQIRVKINDEVKQENNTENLIRSVENLIADVTAFMTLHAGDTLLVGVPENAPLVEENDRVQVEIEGIGVLENIIRSERDVVGGDTL